MPATQAVEAVSVRCTSLAGEEMQVPDSFPVGQVTLCAFAPNAMAMGHAVTWRDLWLDRVCRAVGGDVRFYLVNCADGYTGFVLRRLAHVFGQRQVPSELHDITLTCNQSRPEVRRLRPPRVGCAADARRRRRPSSATTTS